MNLNQKLTTDGLTGVLFCDIHIDIGSTLNLLQCLRVICGCRAVQTNSAETVAGIAGYVAIVTVSSPQACHQYSMNILVFMTMGV